MRTLIVAAWLINWLELRLSWRDEKAEESRRDETAGALKVGRSIDTEGNSVNDRHIDPHLGFESAQLLKLFALFQRRRRQRDEALEAVAAIGIDTDVMVKRPIARRRRGAREIERAQPVLRRSACRRL